jgi:ABC-type nitrate/sulfonate/bicarbonate transport system permease component
VSEAVAQRAPSALAGSLGQWWRTPWFLRLASIAVVLGAWEAYGRTIPVIFISRPSLIAAAASDLLTSRVFWHQLTQTVTALAVGFAISIVWDAAAR